MNEPLTCKIDPNQDPEARVAAPLQPPKHWFFDKPEWLTAAYGPPVDVCEDVGRVAFRIGQWALPFASPYQTPLGKLTHPPKAEPDATGWGNAITVINAAGEPEVINVGLIGAAHSPDSDALTHSQFIDQMNEYHLDARLVDLGSVTSNPYAGVIMGTYHQDEIGPYVLGAIVPNVTYKDLATIQASQVSGEWIADIMQGKYIAYPPALVGLGNALRADGTHTEQSLGVVKATPEESATVADDTSIQGSNEMADAPTISKTEFDDLAGQVSNLVNMVQGITDSQTTINDRLTAVEPTPEPEPDPWAGDITGLQDTVTELREEVAAVVSFLYESNGVDTAENVDQGNADNTDSGADDNIADAA